MKRGVGTELPALNSLSDGRHEVRVCLARSLSLTRSRSLSLVPSRLAVSARPTITDDEQPTPGLIQLTQASFAATLADLSSSYDYVLIEFYSHWCPACKAFQPAYKEIARHVFGVMEEERVAWDRGLANSTSSSTLSTLSSGSSRPVRVAVARVDCPENVELCDGFGIRAYPTMFVDRPGGFLGEGGAAGAGVGAATATATAGERVEVNVKPRTKDMVLGRVGEIVGRGLETAGGCCCCCCRRVVCCSVACIAAYLTLGVCLFCIGFFRCCLRGM